MDIIRFIGELYRTEWTTRRYSIPFIIVVILTLTVFAIILRHDTGAVITFAMIILTTVLYHILRMLTRWSNQESDRTGIDQSNFGKYPQYKIPYLLIKIILILVTLLILALLAMWHS